MSSRSGGARITGVLLTANRPERASQQIRDTSSLFDHLIVADGGKGPSRLGAPRVRHESHANKTTYFATESWSDRITQAARCAQGGAVTFMSDDDVLHPGQLRWYADSLLAEPEAQLAGGPWIASHVNSRALKEGRAQYISLEQVETPWSYLPWLFYGVYRAEAFRFLGEEIVPLSDQLAKALRLKSSISHRRLIELAVVLGGQLLGPTLNGPVGIWGRNRRRSWHERFVLWESYLELEESIISAPANLMSTWSQHVSSGISRHFVERRTHLATPSEFLTSWARTSIDGAHYPAWSRPLLREAGRLGQARK